MKKKKNSRNKQKFVLREHSTHIYRLNRIKGQTYIYIFFNSPHLVRFLFSCSVEFIMNF